MDHGSVPTPRHRAREPLRSKDLRFPAFAAALAAPAWRNVQSYLVEVYLARSRAPRARADGRRARAAAELLSGEGTPVRYVRTTFLPDDETCFHLFEASTRTAVEEVCRRAELGEARIVAAIEASGPAG